jgi:hypothetical protein
MDDLFKEWKKEMQLQLKDLQGIGSGLRGNEEELVKKYLTIGSMKHAFEDTMRDYQQVDDNFEKINKDQDNIAKKLEVLEKEIDNQIKSDPRFANLDKPGGQQNILTKCQEMTKKVSTLDDEMEKMITKLDENQIDRGVSDSGSLQSDTNMILTNFYDSLRQLEIVTMTYQNQLDQIESELNNH